MPKSPKQIFEEIYHMGAIGEYDVEKGIKLIINQTEDSQEVVVPYHELDQE